jgi:hypothetical protein
MTGVRAPARRSGELATLPVLAALAIVPLVVYLRVEPLSGDRFDFWNGQRSNYDFFSYYKARLLVGLVALALAGLIAGIGRRASGLRDLPVPVRLSLAAYAALAIASAWASPFRAVVLDGFPDRYEGLLVLLSYLVVALASFAAFTSAASAQRLVTWLAASAVVVGAIGVLQYAGLDPFQSAWGRALILPAGYDQAALRLMYPAEARTVYSTLYHYNYVGSYAALVLPFLLALLAVDAIPAQSKRLLRAAAWLIGLVWVVSGSRAGMLGGGLALATLAFALRPRLQMGWRLLVLPAIALLLIVVAADLVLGGRVRSRASAWAADLTSVLSTASPRVPVLPLALAAINRSALRLKTPAGLLEIRHEGGTLTILDEEHRQLRLVMSDQSGRIQIDDPRFADLVCTVGRINGMPSLVVQNQAYVLNFLLLESGIRPAMKTGRPVPPGTVESLGFAGRERLGSARGFIWSRSLPLLRHTLLLGFGPDTFPMVFPQQDFAGKFQAYGTTDMLVDKAHNFFLQTALNTGALSALALMVLFGWYLAASARIYSRRPAAETRTGVGLACFVGVVGYLGAAVFNDSVVCVAPVFWVVLGLGIRMNVESAGLTPR